MPLVKDRQYELTMCETVPVTRVDARRTERSGVWSGNGWTRLSERQSQG